MAKKNEELKVDSYYEERNRIAEELIPALAAAPSPLLPNERIASLLLKLRELAPLQEPTQYPKGSTEGLLSYLADFADLDRRERALQSELKDIATRKARLTGGDEGHGPLMEAWLNSGMGNVQLAGRTFYIHGDRRLVRKKEVTPKAALTALRRAHLGVLVTETYNSQTLKSWLIDREESGKGIPKGIGRHFEVFERTSIRSRKASSK